MKLKTCGKPYFGSINTVHHALFDKMSKKLFQQYLIDQKRHSGSPLSGSVTPPLCGTRSVSPLTPFTPVKPSKKRTRNKVSHSKKDTTNQAVAKKKIKHANPSSFVMHGNSTTSSMTFTLSQSAAKSSVTNNNCKPETKNNSNSKSTVATPETVRNRLYMLQTALKTGIFHSPLDSKQTLNINQLDSREMNSRIRLLLRISAVSYSASPTDLELLDNALNELCCTEFDMSLLCKIIAQVARVQIKVGVATLPIARCSAAEKFSFGDLVSRNKIPERCFILLFH